ncbi:dihydrodipicolinate synthase family protein [Halanaerobium hydrogeniformans]|uniref:Dihydrodipicolinate synthetase n=1 Tax=Halanaerobium hydrogeniformans TaxID=656519 RepID=E4RPK5_HALHG|nr:dihydrodipicolinate synthase family protein [Halanaerobium hydrogeniformans]ADQ14028.1 dihydrodipicolinate synthetase [Halanaerobium hydrogeniformans]
MEQKEILKGIIPPMITPLNKDFKIDRKSTEKLVDYLIDGGIHTLFILGTTGEGPLISKAEQFKLAKFVVEYTEGRVPVIAGVSAPSSLEVLKNIENLNESGLDGYVSTLPFYDKTNLKEEIKHFEILAAESELPIIIYDIPVKVGQRLSEKALENLVEVDNIIGLKDSSSNLRNFRERVEKFRHKKDFSFALGHSDMIDISIYLGADGVVPSDVHLFPELCVEIYNNAQKEDWIKARKLQSELNKKRIELYNSFPAQSRANNKVCKKHLKAKGIIASDYIMAPYI